MVSAKQRDYQGGRTFAFALKYVSLGFDQDGDEVTSGVVEVADAAPRDPPTQRGAIEDHPEAFDMLVADGLSRPNPGGTGYPEPSRFHCVDLPELRRLAQGKMVGTDTGKLFRQAFQALSEQRGLICMTDNLVWCVDRRIN